MHFKTLFLALCAVLITTLGACKPSSGDYDGIYEVTRDNGIVGPAAKNGACPSGYTLENNFSNCIEKIETTDTLALRAQPDGSLDFAVMAWFFNGHLCGLEGRAEKYEAGWRYKETIDEAESDYNPGCLLDINIEDDSIVLRADETQSCRYYCGARGSLHHIRFPLQSRTDKPVPQNIECATHMEGMDTCVKADEAAADLR